MADAKAWGRPQPRQAPDVPYHNPTASNPILRGWSLAVVTTVLSSSPMLQGVLWRMNSFDKLKELPALQGIEPRFDPTVVPKDADGDVLASVRELSAPQKRKTPTSFYTSADFVELYKAGTLTPVDVVEHLLPLIRRDTKPPGKYSVGWISVRADLILEEAKASTERYKAGNPLGPLDGVPIAVKDSCDITGYKQTQGCPVDFTGPGDKTAWAVAKWQEAGAVILGKTNMHPYGLDTTNVNATFGTPRNPHNPAYFPGGSSGGSAYALASGIVPIALGFDGGGSNRIPASFCGMYGLKPTHGRVSSRAGDEPQQSVTVCGPLASSIDDLALAYRVMAQPDSLSTTSVAFPSSLVAPRSSPTGPKRLGIMRSWIERSDPDVVAAFDHAVAHLTKTQGYEVIDITIPLLPEGQKAHAMTIVNEARAYLSPKQYAAMNYHTQLLLATMTGRATGQDFLFAQRLRSLLMGHLAWLWDKYPGLLVLTPTCTFAGWKIAQESDLKTPGFMDGDRSLRCMEYVYLANFVGAPAISVPMGYNDEGMPMGLMAMAEWANEEQLLGFGRQAEGCLGEEGVRRPKGDGRWVDALEISQRT
ncbi:uncharacterized protein HMPREF1541_01982 [Cyphellophora europaea CBS 101466]|uniref:Amidase domain-containing protein n=1 Tax=Cyphellophora europaea (strain CBS 101466) TaxID=1220924 RepID=W2S4D2_CYPE1|nr:uncharacterized protein HMPREF1541_01982 [Cyphellophora europaea CBS 101466]ETN42824.1 hypothetical protein HMPREF1541_01982 [Cyphellophora europaea CBS 101466]